MSQHDPALPPPRRGGSGQPRARLPFADDRSGTPGASETDWGGSADGGSAGGGRAGGAGRGRGGRGVAAGVISVLILGGLAVGADRIAAGVTQDRVRSVMAEDFAARGSEVAIGGFPFLTQLAAGSLSDVTLSAEQVSIEGITLTDVSGSASGVPTRGSGSIGSVTARARVPAEALQAVLMSELVRNDALAGLRDSLTLTTLPGRVSVGADLGLVTAAIEVIPTAAPRAIELELAQVSVGGMSVEPSDLPFGLGDQLLDAIGEVSVDLDALPQGLELTGVEVTEDGAWITATGTDVVIP